MLVKNILIDLRVPPSILAFMGVVKIHGAAVRANAKLGARGTQSLATLPAVGQAGGTAASLPHKRMEHVMLPQAEFAPKCGRPRK